jgi:NAD(P)-dependent dehydrogenase (short-subunit alcohol dehydrogenase family)
MSELRFDDRVAIITGGGRGLGRAYAELLASRGAKVVVNDPGGSLKGDAIVDDPAGDVVTAIKAAGGEAIANRDTVATAEGGEAIIKAAMDAYGRVDILIHNAGNVRYGSLKELSYEDFESVLSVHLRGAFHVVRPAFPIMCEQKYGRIILTSSIGGLYGNKRVANYGVSKSGIIGLSNVVALEGADEGVKCNVIVPSAVTRMAEGLDTSQYPPLGPELVAPMVGWLSHEDCSISGEMLVAIGGRMARAYIAETEGVYQPDWSMEQVDARIAEIRDERDPWHLPVLPDAHKEHIVKSFAMVAAWSMSD